MDRGVEANGIWGQYFFPTNIRGTNEEVSYVAAERRTRTSMTHAGFWKEESDWPLRLGSWRDAGFKQKTN